MSNQDEAEVGVGLEPIDGPPDLNQLRIRYRRYGVRVVPHEESGGSRGAGGEGTKNGDQGQPSNQICTGSRGTLLRAALGYLHSTSICWGSQMSTP